MKVYVLLLFFPLLFVQCRNEIDLIPEDQMVDIMMDMHVGDQILRKYDPVLRDSIREEIMRNLLKLHNVTYEQLDTNLYIYQLDINGFKDLTQKVVDRMQENQEKMSDASEQSTNNE
jgi:hypothetical protein